MKSMSLVHASSSIFRFFDAANFPWNMAVAASGQGGLMVRVDPDETDGLLASLAEDVDRKDPDFCADCRAALERNT